MPDNKQHSQMVSAYFRYCVSILGKIDNKHVRAPNYLEYAWSAYPPTTLKMEYADHK